MLPKHHIIFGLLFALAAFILFPRIGLIGTSIIFLSSVLIDVDHYLFYAFSKKDFSLKNAYEWFIEKSKTNMCLPKNQIKTIPCLFHGIETSLILILLIFISPIFFFILLGFLFHQSLDLVDIHLNKQPFKHLGSQTYNFLAYRVKP